MIGKISIGIAAFISGSLLGFIVGAILGAVFGVGVSLFFEEILLAHKTVLMSILLSLIFGGLLGLLALQITNKLFESNDPLSVGIAAGAILGVIVMVFFYGYIDISNMRFPDPDVRGSHDIVGLPFDYSVSIGSRIGAIVFPLFVEIALVREEIKNYMEFRKKRKREDESKNELLFYRSKNSVDDQ